VGGSREMKLVLAYELPLILVLLFPVIQLHSLRLGDILLGTTAVQSISGILALLVSILCMQAKLTLIPFDMPEAETGIHLTNEYDYVGFHSEDFEERVEKELLLCESWGVVIAPIALITWLAKRLGPLAYDNPTLMLTALKRIASG
jgi:NADH dehydrogenase